MVAKKGKEQLEVSSIQQLLKKCGGWRACHYLWEGRLWENDSSSEHCFVVAGWTDGCTSSVWLCFPYSFTTSTKPQHHRYHLPGLPASARRDFRRQSVKDSSYEVGTSPLFAWTAMKNCQQFVLRNSSSSSVVIYMDKQQCSLPLDLGVNWLTQSQLLASEHYYRTSLKMMSKSIQRATRRETRKCFLTWGRSLVLGFLNRPINLALACYMYRYMSLGIKGLHHVSQTQLFSQIVLQLLMVYIKKESHIDLSLENILDFFSTNDKRLTGAKVFFKEICRLCHETCQMGTMWLSTVDTDITVNDFMSFGLFCPGPKPNTIDLPHRLFQEFFAAVYLVRNQAAWKALFQDIKKKCQDSDSTSRTRHYLSDVLEHMGLESVVRFIVGLSATHGQELCSLFAIKQSVTGKNTKQSVYSYELQVLSECTADCVKSVAEALINAPVITVGGWYDYVNNSGAEQLVDMLSPKQSRQFLAKAYGCEVKREHFWPGDNVQGKRWPVLCLWQFCGALSTEVPVYSTRDGWRKCI